MRWRRRTRLSGILHGLRRTTRAWVPPLWWGMRDRIGWSLRMWATLGSIAWDGEIEQLTRDHSLIQDVVDQGFFKSLEDAQRYGINENILTRGLGSANPVVVDTGEADLRSGDLYLFCTDGLTGMVTDDGIRRILLTGGNDLDRLSSLLVDLACEGGGLDNITVALMRVS